MSIQTMHGHAMDTLIFCKKGNTFYRRGTEGKMPIVKFKSQSIEVGGGGAMLKAFESSVHFTKLPTTSFLSTTRLIALFPPLRTCEILPRNPTVMFEIIGQHWTTIKRPESWLQDWENIKTTPGSIKKRPFYVLESALMGVCLSHCLNIKRRLLYHRQHQSLISILIASTYFHGHCLKWARGLDRD